MATFDFSWSANDDGGPRIPVVIQNPLDVLNSGQPQHFGLPDPIPVMALIDTGAGISAISRVLAQTLKLRLTNEGSKIRTLGATIQGAEYAASVSFPNTGLRSLVPIRLFSGDFSREPFSCIIGRDILQYWKITFDGPGRKVCIVD